MIVKIRSIFFILLMIVALTGCRNNDHQERTPAPRPQVSLTLHLTSPETIADAATKTPVPPTALEKAIRNLNIYLFPKNHPAAYAEADKRHYFFPKEKLIPDPTDPSGSSYLPITLENISLGEYEVYIIANNSGGNLCAKTHGDDPAGCLTRHQDMPTIETSRTRAPETTGIIMSGKIESLKVMANTELTDPIRLTFNMARVVFAYNRVNDDAKNLEIYSITLQNAVIKARPFGNGTWELGNNEPYDELPIRKFVGPPFIENEYTTTIYLGANPQGGIDIPTGGDPNLYRTAKYAPTRATYAYYSCQYNGSVIGYTAFLGDDKPDQNSRIYFDIIPNTVYNIATNFNTPDLDDERICSFIFEPNRPKLYFGTSGDFVWEGTNTKVPDTDMTLNNGKVAIETNFKLTMKNYFNDKFEIRCAAVPASGSSFRVYTEGATTPLPNIGKNGDNAFIVKETTTDTEYVVEMKVVFEQELEAKSQKILFQIVNRNGQMLETETIPFNVLKP